MRHTLKPNTSNRGIYFYHPYGICRYYDQGPSWGWWWCIRLVLFTMLLVVQKDSQHTAQALAAGGIKTRSFVFSPKQAQEKPKLVLISGCPGTGKSTFGMSVALDQGILKCISTDTIRAVMRSFIPKDISPALHRSSYAKASENDDPVQSWKETCKVLEASVEELVIDSIQRRQGLVLEGVNITPNKKWIQMWEDAGGVATGCLLTVTDGDTHKSLLQKRGFLAGQQSEQNTKDQNKIKSFDRIRLIQDEMIHLASESGWIMIEQKVEHDPWEIIASKLTDDECEVPLSFQTNALVNSTSDAKPSAIGKVIQGSSNDDARSSSSTFFQKTSPPSSA